ncbi:MAG TPA: glycosyltransferase, partial [Hyphomicrobiaceae bacterium]|nr:glycosyltransferase [Hyphomicrobiaceae bacterium]
MTAPLTCIYVTDRTFLACTCFSVRTLIVNATIPLTVHILHTGIDREAIAEAEGYLRPAIGTGTEVVFTEMPPAEFSGLPKPQSLPSSSYGRLLVHKILPDLEGRVLYLDGDTLVDLDVAPL